MTDATAVNRPLLGLGALVGAAGVALAARGTHGAEPDMQIAANFLLFHAPALLGVSLLAVNRLSQPAGYLMLVGLIVFCGDLAMRAELGTPMFPLAAPIGGVLLIAGWLLLALSAIWGWRRAG